ncbi:Tetratricopeptide repeat-containing protein [Fodinibius salinus]|uniref:Tetratricopeptide repeat-containing protein n=1 Tax=Fodinibius salinus TaxID=860790 RepID=A0A5D3YLI6_9BACT|nr:tetratricopeptide repeat protein [Fodinibius salinus]TYP95045.1 Tetratricopeptide repeat-containing protein [Fodinibius salinus]
MKFLKLSLTTVIVSILLLGLNMQANAQSKRAAIKSYNKALDLSKSGEYEQAINVLTQVVVQAEELGEEGKDILKRSQQKLPQVHYQLAIEKYKAFKNNKNLENIDAAIEEFRNTKDVAEEYGDDKRAQKANGIVTQLMYSKSLVQFNQSNHEQALATLNQVIERNANYAKAYYQKGIVIKNMDSKNLEKAITQFDKAIEVAEETGDNQIVTKARKSARDELVYRGVKATENKKVDRALELLQRALTYDSSSAKTHYRLAEAYNKTQDWQKALDHAQKGLENESGGKTEKARIYFELATAYQGMGDKENACTAFGNAAYGSFKSPAEHAMEYDLKCENTTN